MVLCNGIVTEIWFTQKYAVHETILKDFQILFCLEKDICGGGVSIYVIPNISCTRSYDLEQTKLEHHDGNKPGTFAKKHTP